LTLLSGVSSELGNWEISIPGMCQSK
jgi:hypothetical protein